MKLFDYFTIIGILSLTGCSPLPEPLPQGPWLGVITIDSTDPSLVLPFQMNYTIFPDGQDLIEITNAGEVISIDEITRSGDTFTIKFPVFTSEIFAVVKDDSLTGYYYPRGQEAGNPYSFYAVYGESDRFPWYTDSAGYNVSGRWKIVENPGTEDSVIMVGEFLQEGNRVTGTILNTGGDYRFLEGKVSGSNFMLSGIDGAHTLILTAIISPEGKMVSGRFMGSPKWKSNWEAERDENIVLPQGESLVKLKQKANNFGFSFPDLNGDTVSLSDPRFRNKVVIVQAVGTWCPNCLDEAMFYKELYNQFRDLGLEIVALCFEDQTFDSSVPKIRRFKTQTGADYLFLYAGARGRESIRKVLYNLEGRMAYPTTLFIDRNGEIRKVETGFTGPGTGQHYTRFVDNTTRFVTSLLQENR